MVHDYFRMVLPIKNCYFFNSNWQIHSSSRALLLWSGLSRLLINLERVYPYFLKGPPTHWQSDFIFIRWWENIMLMPTVSDQGMCERQRERKICIKRQANRYMEYYMCVCMIYKWVSVCVCVCTDLNIYALEMFTGMRNCMWVFRGRCGFFGIINISEILIKHYTVSQGNTWHKQSYI